MASTTSKTTRSRVTDSEDGKFTAGRTWRITDHASADVLPVFSPDGKQLMWTSNRSTDGTSQLWIGDFKLPEKE